MAELDDVMLKLHSMSITDLSILRSELVGVMQSRALAELEHKERELNDLRVLAGLKKKPIKKPKNVEDVAVPSGRGRPKKTRPAE